MYNYDDPDWPYDDEQIDENCGYCSCDLCLGLEDESGDDFFDNDVEEVTGGDSYHGESMSSVGTRFATRNSTVAKLPAGALLEVVAAGTLEIVDLPAKVYQPGDRFNSKYGPATVVRFSDRIDFNVDVENGEVAYIADGTSVVRRQFVS